VYIIHHVSWFITLKRFLVVFLSFSSLFYKSQRLFCTNNVSEIWKKVLAPELNYLFSRYEISNEGRIRNIKSGKILKPYLGIIPYPVINLTHDNCNAKNILIHRLVCSIFHGPPKGDKTKVHHKNHIKTDYRETNLEWTSSSENNTKYYRAFGSQKRSGKSILKVNKNGNIVERFDSITDAAKAGAISSSKMSYLVKNKKIHDEHSWELEKLVEIENELWKICYEDEKIMISNMGRVKCSKTERLIKVFLLHGYLLVGKRGRPGSIKFRVHRLVASMFCSNPENKPFVDHIDGNKINNHSSNLRWVTDAENKANPNTTRNRNVFQKCPKSKKIINKFSSIRKAADYVDGSAGNISQVCKGKRWTCKGFIWEYG
jgi:hypothetical protein